MEKNHISMDTDRKNRGSASYMSMYVYYQLPYRGKHWRVATLANSLQKHVDEINFGEFEALAKFYLI